MDNKHLWSSVLSELQLSLSAANFKTFFSGTSIVSSENSIFTIGCPHVFAKDWIQKKHETQIKEILQKLTKENVSIIFTIETSAKPVKAMSDKESDTLFSYIDETPKTSFVDLLNKSHLRADFTFETYAVSTSNQLAYAASQAVSRSLGSAYNPLFLHGGVGIGKTHLMQAVGHAALRDNPKLSIIYCMGEEFTNEIIAAIQSKNTKRFKDKYRSADLLLMDDVQFIAGKTAVQEEFFHTFNAIQREGGQIVLTSDRPPTEIAKLEERIRSRFEAGMIIDIQQPDFELRTAILLIKAKSRNVNLSLDMAKLIAEQVDSPRKLEGFLTRLLAESQLRNAPITPEFVTKILGNNTEAPKEKNIASYRDFEIAISEYFNVPISDLKGERRSVHISKPRQLLMYLLRIELGLPLMEIGDILGGRDHTTVLHGVDKITKQLQSSPQLQEGVLWIKRKVYGHI